jgi:hypothetical protein
MNIVSMIMQVLASSLVNKLAASVGINSSLAQRMIGAAVPAILAGIVGRTSQPAGAAALFDMLGKQAPGVLTNLANCIGGSQQTSVAEQGLGALGSLLGNSALSSLTGALSKFTGTSETATTGLLGILTPAVLGTLGQQQKASSLDAGGLAALLAGQKNNIAAAIPGDFAKMLGGTGLLDGIGGNLAKTGSAASAITQTFSRVATTSSYFKWWPWASALALAAIGSWYWFAGRTPPQVSITAPPQIMIGSTNVADQLGGVMSTLRASLTGIKDAASAEVAMPKLREAQAEIDRLNALAGQLTGDSKKSFAAYVASWIPIITPLVNSLLANSTVGPVVKPMLDTLTTRLNAMAQS